MADQKTVLTILAKDKTAAAFKSIQNAASKTRKVVGGLAITFTKFGVASATAAVGAAAAFTRMRMNSIDNLAKVADKIGTTTETLAGLQHAANLTGVSTETMNMALQRMTRRVAEAAVGTGEAKGALEELNIDATQLVKLPLDQQMAIVADAMKGVGTQADRVRLAMKLFDSEGVALVNTLGGGSEALQDMMNEAKALGTALSRVDAARVEEANDAIDRAKAVFAGVGNQLAVAFADQIAFAANMFRQAALDAEGFGTIGQRVANAVTVGFARLADFLHRTVLLGKQIQLVFVNMAKGVLESIGPDSLIIRALDFLIDKYNSIASVLGFDTIPTAAEGLERITAGFGEQADELRAEIREMIEAPLPSTQILARLEEVTAGARKMAEEIAGAAPAAAEAAGEVTEDAKKKTSTLSSDLSDALISGVTDGKEGMLRSFSNILTEMASQVLKSQLMNAFKSIFPGGGAAGGGLGGIFGSIGAALGFKADGGSVTGGRPYIVGERGPELMVPGRSGAVIPNDQLGGGGLNYAPVVNISGGASEQDRAIFSAELRRQKAEIADMLARRRF
jgi:hypothetical protein